MRDEVERLKNSKSVNYKKTFDLSNVFHLVRKKRLELSQD